MDTQVHLDSHKLRQVRANVDLEKLIAAYGIQVTQRKRSGEIIGFSPLKEEETPSFHIQADGRWYCFATHQGGGPLELIQTIDQLPDPYAAGRRALELGVSTIIGEVRSGVSIAAPERSEGEKTPPPKNEPIQQDLRKALSYHPHIADRGIPEEVSKELGFGFYDPGSKSRSLMKDRIVFQVRGLRKIEDEWQSVILTHMGRDLTPENAHGERKWRFYSGFHASAELYNLDLAALDLEAVKQAQQTGHVIVVEGCFDLAKLYAAGIRNVVASFGGDISPHQLPCFELLSDLMSVKRVHIFYDRGRTEGAQRALHLLEDRFPLSTAFDWSLQLGTRKQQPILIPDTITDPCTMSIEQLQWLRAHGHL